MIADIVSVAILTLVVCSGTYTLVTSARDGTERGKYRSVLAAVRPWMIPAAIAQIACVGAVVALLWNVPYLNWGWWSALGNTGNVNLGQTDFDGPIGVALALAVPLLLLGIMPMIAYYEEDLFRGGSENWNNVKRFGMIAAFGFIHPLLAGVPLFAGIALMVSGCYFMGVYLRTYREHGLYKAAAAHYVSNALLVAFLLGSIIFAMI